MKRHVRKGKFAAVWDCQHKPTGTIYAVKVIQRAGLEPKDDEAVLNEVAVLQSLSGNKYVVQLLDFYEEVDCFYLVMEYCSGGDVHRAGIAHRDIKPQNLFLLSNDDNSLIRVADFGFARRVNTPESLIDHPSRHANVCGAGDS
jgi:serine/threonine protein kinase